MAAGTLYTYPQSFRANKALIAAQFSGADVRVAQHFKLGETNKSADFLKKFPNGKVPTFEGNDGFCLCESNAIAFYVSNSQLRGADAKQEAQVQQWISFSDNEILPAACTWTFPCHGITQYNKQETERAKEQVKKVLDLLNSHLLTRTYVVGERVTLADISLVCNLQSLFTLVLDPAFRKPYGNVTRWFNTLINQPQFKAVLGNVQLAVTMAVFDAKKYQELHRGGGDKKKEKDAPKKEKVQPKAKEAPKPKPAPEVEEEKPAPKPKDPLVELPPGKMDLDEFKRVYSNQDIVTKAVPYFWEHFDKECQSIWRCDYAEDIAGQKSFMLSNLVSGFLQRIEKVRKYGFASMIISGSDATQEYGISGLWFWRGQKQIFELTEDWNVDAPSYKWTKLDPDAPETKDVLTQFFIGDGIIEGKEVIDCKTFK